MSSLTAVRSRRPSRSLLLALIAAFCFSAVVSQALAGHFHSYACNGGCSIGHGLVHGANTDDGSFFSRIDQHPSNSNAFWSECALRRSSDTSRFAYEESGSGQGCNAWSNYQASERGSFANTRSFDTPGEAIPLHSHYPHQ